MNSEAWWVGTSEFLPSVGERVLVITKTGRVSNMMYDLFGEKQEKVFSPGYFRAGIDVKWWMPIPTDGWNDIKEIKPNDGQSVLVMGMYGEISDVVYKMHNVSRKMEFVPFTGYKILFWRDMPELPEGVDLFARRC